VVVLVQAVGSAVVVAVRDKRHRRIGWRLREERS